MKTQRLRAAAPALTDLELAQLLHVICSRQDPLVVRRALAANLLIDLEAHEACEQIVIVANEVRLAGLAEVAKS